MCTSWPVTLFSCLTSASQWPPQALQAWPWPPLPAPLAAAPQTEPTLLNRLTKPFEIVGWGGVTPYCVLPPNSIPPCHVELKRKRLDNGKGVGENSWTGWEGDQCHPSSLSCPPTSAYLSIFPMGVALFWGSKPWTNHSKE